MKRISGVLFVLLAVMNITACSSPSRDIKISGEALYLERIGLPANAEWTIAIQDVSLADAPAKLVAQTVKKGAMTPVSFSFCIPDSEFKQKHTYAVSAKITVDGKLWFINDQRYQINFDDNQPLSIIVRRVIRE